MQLITDRPQHDCSLLGKLQLVGHCRRIALHEAVTRPLADELIVIDVSLDNLAAALLLRSVLHLHHNPRTPLLFVLAEPSHHALTQAKSLGATEVIVHAAPVRTLLSLVRSLLPEGRRQDAIGTNCEQAALAVADMLDVRASTTGLLSEQLLSGSATVLDALEEGDLSGWVHRVWEYDDRTYQHCLLVAGLAAAFAISLGLSRADRMEVTLAALVHDVGKALVPTSILNKPEKLSASEVEIVRKHPVLGYHLLRRSGSTNQAVLDTVLHHHEFLDGSGYPDGLKGTQVQDLVRIVTICDIFGALLERRAYKPPQPARAAFEYLVQMKSKVDQDLTRAFARVALDPGLAVDSALPAATVSQ